MPIPYDKAHLRQLQREGARIIRPTTEQFQYLRRYKKQFGNDDVRMELVRRDTNDGSEYQPQIVIKGGNI